MPDVQFQEDQFAPRPGAAPLGAQQTSFLTRMVYASGLAKDEQGATRAFIGIAFVVVIAAIGIFIFANPSPPKVQPLISDPPAL